METIKITKQIVDELINEAFEKGKSRQIPVDNSQIAYFRLLVSTYNKKNSVKISINRAHGVYMEVSAPNNRIIDLPRYKNAFAILSSVLHSDDRKVSLDEFKEVETALNELNEICRSKVLEIKIIADTSNVLA